MKITRFKDYNGNTIIVDSHKHSVTDTVANGSTAIVSTTQSEMFKGCSTATGSKVTVNYKSAGKTTATNMVATKDSTSNVGLGSLIA